MGLRLGTQDARRLRTSHRCSQNGEHCWGRGRARHEVLIKDCGSHWPLEALGFLFLLWFSLTQSLNGLFTLCTKCELKSLDRMAPGGLGPLLPRQPLEGHFRRSASHWGGGSFHLVLRISGGFIDTLQFLPLREGHVPSRHRPGPWKLISWTQGPPTVYDDDDYCRVEIPAWIPKVTTWKKEWLPRHPESWITCGLSEELGVQAKLRLYRVGQKRRQGTGLSVLYICEPIEPLLQTKRETLLLLLVFMNVPVRPKVVKCNTSKARSHL